MTNNKIEDLDVLIENARAHNNELIAEFKKELIAKSLKEKTIHKHISNIEFYANDFLLYYDIVLVEDGCLDIDSFLGDFFIRKALWSSKNAIKDNIVSLKKFYTFLKEKGVISEKQLFQMKDLINCEKEFWFENMDAYMDNINKEW